MLQIRPFIQEILYAPPEYLLLLLIRWVGLRVPLRLAIGGRSRYTYVFLLHCRLLLEGRMTTEAIPTVYTLTTCPACTSLRIAWTEQGIAFEERQVDKSQSWLDEALVYGDEVPIIVHPDGRVEIGFEDEIG